MNRYLAIVTIACVCFVLAQAKEGDKRYGHRSVGQSSGSDYGTSSYPANSDRPSSGHYSTPVGGSSSRLSDPPCQLPRRRPSKGLSRRRRSPFTEITSEDDVTSQLSLTPSNDEEVASLEGKAAAFSDFCISSRDYVIGDFKATGNSMAARLFSLFFSGAENLGLEAVKIQREAADRLANQIRNPSAPIANVDGDNQVDAIIAEGQRNIAANPWLTSQPRNILQGVVSALAATRNAVTSHVLGVLNQLKAGAKDLATFTGALRDACDRVAEYDQEIMNRFLAARSELAAHDAAIASIGLENVGCVTVRRIVRLDGICKFAMAATNPLIKAITYKPIDQ